MSDELFPSESVTVKSPKLRWMERHGVTVGPLEFKPSHPDDFRHAFSVIAEGRGFAGYGNSEQEALRNWAKAAMVRLWNEERNDATGSAAPFPEVWRLPQDGDWPERWGSYWLHPDGWYRLVPPK